MNPVDPEADTDAEGAAWDRLAGLLPEPAAGEVRDCWEIGEQEAGLGLLVGGLLAYGVALDGTTRAELSVLTETWGEREALAARLAACADTGAPSPVRLLPDGETDGETDGESGGESGDTTGDPVSSVRVPWIACDRCGATLLRIHTRDPWGEPSYLTEAYVVGDRSWDTAADAYAALLACSLPA
ncbi:hypothetical protein ACFVQ4_21200 [Streptomyces laurentii]|uniref:hypothetical protein n=1 Tax=Streptomyces laurentii TaxID=39478 RepID=UPI003686E3A8